MSAPDRPDVPHVGLYNRFEDAIGAASRNAALTRWKYKVRWEPNNRWWHVTMGAPMKREAQR